MSGGICSLPVELIRYITDDLPFSDILTLRLTCRTLRAKATDRRFEQRFTSPTCDMSPRSLARLAAIAASPIGHLVRAITLVTTLLDGGGDRQRPSEDAIGRDDSSSASDAEDAAVHEVFPDHHRAAREAGEELRASGRDLELLCAAFGALGKLERLALDAVGLRSWETPPGRKARLRASGATMGRARRPPAGGHPIDDYGCGDRDDLRMMANHDFAIVLKAMVRTKIAIESISAYSRAWGCSLLATELRELIQTMPKAELETALSCVTSLTVSITGIGLLTWGKFAKKEPRPPVDGALEGFEQLLAAAGRLRNVDILRVKPNIRVVDEGEEQDFSAFARRVAASSLRSLTLRGFRIRTDDLVNLLQRCDKLEEVEFREASIVEGQWSQVFQCLGTMAQLRQVTLFRCYEDRLILITRPAGAEIDEMPANLGCECTRTTRMTPSQIRDGVEYHQQMVSWKCRPWDYYYRLARVRVYSF
ncbi:hypothetical protein GTA08_BOTSDO02286 [Botryosphaeria dothidea]|uniref:F-box domain-containing protein n=1 Tax=Botryosphaeria dothidea TaxID=55169 RepID=A0A8H4N5U0_9PEZI|nr:hypothetical protein GTA08_BOTSDO02286 [Botryosphaeria dothidea]